MPPWRGGRQAAYARYRAKVREAINAAKRDRPCADCGVVFPPCAMDFDHRDPATKKFGIGLGAQSLPATLAEIEKCDLVCANCHRIRTHGESCV